MRDPLSYERNADLEREFDILITLLADMITANAAANPNVPAPAWSVDLHVLSMKLFKHFCSIRTLLEPSGFRTRTLPPYAYIDYSSVLALTRTAVENYLVMFWLYSDGDEALREFRHTLWTYSGWRKRSRFVPTLEDLKKDHQEAIANADELWLRVVASPYFQSYSKDDKRRLRKGNWNAGSDWNELAEKAGIHPTYFTSIYPYLSGYTHSDYISCMQMGQAVDLGTQYSFGTASLQISLMMIGHLSHFYADLFPPAKTVLQRPGHALELATKWYIRRDDMAFLYEGLDSAVLTPDSAPRTA